jgi:hypothetical protein
VVHAVEGVAWPVVLPGAGRGCGVFEKVLGDRDGGPAAFLEARMVAPPRCRVGVPVSRWISKSEATALTASATRSPSAFEAFTTGPGTADPAWISTFRAPFCRPAIMSIWRTAAMLSPAAAAAAARAYVLLPTSPCSSALKGGSAGSVSVPCLWRREWPGTRRLP